MVTPSFIERAQSYLDDARVIHPTCFDTYRHHVTGLNRLVADLGDPVAWGEKEILTVRDRLLAKYAPSTASVSMAMLAGILTSVGNGTMAQMRQRKRLKMPEPDRGEVRWHTSETMDRLLLTAEGNLGLVLRLGFFLGLRVGEMVTLRASDILPDTLRVRGKGQRTRTLPLEGETRKVILYYSSRATGTHLLTHRGRAYTTRGIRKMVRKHGKRNGVLLSPHDMRRTFGRELWKRGARIETISKLMGHRRLETTIKYLGLDLEDMREAIALLQ